jgi:Secretion system C-terminal sorting domain
MKSKLLIVFLFCVSILISPIVSLAQEPCAGGASQLTMSMYNYGSFPSELSFSISDENGDVLFGYAFVSLDINVLSQICLFDGCYQLKLNDSFGDGWNGAVLELAINGATTSYTMTSGSVAAFYFGVNTPECSGSNIFGCTNPQASNYSAEATVDDNSCYFGGCTDPNAINYDPAASLNDGSCDYCSDENSVSAPLYICTLGNGQDVSLSIADEGGNVVYQSAVLPVVAIINLTICLQPGVCYTATLSNTAGPFGWFGGYFTVSYGGIQVINSSLPNGLASTDVQFSIDGTCGPVLGCNDPSALNYNQDAEMNDGSCVYPVYGCTDPLALNYNAIATTDDGSCVLVQECGTGTTPVTVQFAAGNWAFEGSYTITDAFGAIWFSGNAQSSIAFSCLPDGCYTINMYDSYGDGWDGGGYLSVQFNGGSNIYTFTTGTFATASFGINSEDCVADVLGCTDPTAANYNAQATSDDGSCYYPENCDYNAISIIVCTQLFGSEISWSLVDSDGNAVAASSGYSSWNCYNQSFCVADGCYTLNMSDSWGDGWNGGYIIVQGAGIYFEGGLFYGSAESAMVSVNSSCSDVYGCMNADAMNYNPNATMDDGSCTMNDNNSFNANGLFVLGLELNMYPNPVEDGMVVNLNNLDKSSAVTIDIISIDGKLISSQTIQNEEKSKNIKIDMGNYAPGYYFLKVKSGASFIARPFVKQ